MTLLGLDFDNTLIRYDRLFHKLAVEKNLIGEALPANKIIIRDYLRSKGQDDEFTILQGEVYGLRIVEAEPAEGMLAALRELDKQGIEMILISHKTKTPYKGPSYDLRGGALKWLDRYGFFDPSGLGWSKANIFFESSKALKVTRIQDKKCDYYIDDLEDILEMLPNTINKIHYCPNNHSSTSKFIALKHWSNINTLINQDEKG